jgi:glutathionylspermidine synthase
LNLPEVIVPADVKVAFDKNLSRLLGSFRRKSESKAVERWMNKRHEQGDIPLFVYGSLLDPDSLGLTIGRPVSASDYFSGVLFQVKKVWGAPVAVNNYVKENTFDAFKGKRLALSVYREDGASATGALVWVSDDEMRRLKLREQSYSLSHISGDRFWSFGGSNKLFQARDKIAVFVADEGAFDRGVVPQAYRAMVKAAYDKLAIPFDIIGEPATKPIVDIDRDLSRCCEKKSQADLARLHRSLLVELEEHEVFRGVDTEKNLIPSIARPLLFSSNLYDNVAKIAEQAVNLSCKTLRESLFENNFSALSGVGEQDIALAKELPDTLPLVARVALIVSHDDIKVLEVNTDSPAGMIHTDVLLGFWGNHQKNISTELMKKCAPLGPVLTKAIVPGVQKRWKAISEEKAKFIVIADIDAENQRTNPEFHAFRKIFSDAFELTHKDVKVADVRDIEEQDGALYLKGRKIDILYKRVVASDLGSKECRIADVLGKAAVHGKTLIFNDLFSRLAGNKYIYYILSKNSDIEEPLRSALLSTYTVDEFQEKHDVRDTAGKYVLKGCGGYGAANVELKKDPNTWAQVIKKASIDSIVQKRVEHGRAYIPTSSGKLIYEQFLVGAYVIDGACIALEAKFSSDSKISINRNASRTVILRRSLTDEA